MRPSLGRGLALLLSSFLLLLHPAAGWGAEVLQVRSATLLQVGDHNRNYSVELACLSLPPEGEAAAVAWMRQQLPRRTRVNLKPAGSHDGILMARVQRIEAGDATPLDLGDGLVAAGLASALPHCGS